MQSRAKQFLAFDALKGFRKYLKAKEEIIVSVKDLSDDLLYELEWKIKLLKTGMLVTVVYFYKNRYISVTGIISKLDLNVYNCMHIVNTKIMIKDIISIEIDRMVFDESNSMY